MSELSAARYGKDNIRLCKVHRDEGTNIHTVTEMTVCVLVEGDINSSYTRADNSVVVATDSMKNTVYLLAKQYPVTPPELFGSILASHFIELYPNIHVTRVKVVTHRWTRMTIDGEPHPHSFLRDGAETRNAEVVCKRGTGIFVKSGIQGLLVLKSTGSAFYGFIKNDYTSLGETSDRILSTEVDANWEWGLFNTLGDVERNIPLFDMGWESARNITLQTFAKDNSVSVQATMYKMANKILEAVPEVNNVDYSLPNKHYFEIDMKWHNEVKNTGKDAEVYAPQSDPNGLIKCTVSRTKTSKL